MAAEARHHWRFFRAGGFDQVNIVCGADLLHLHELDQKLWVALACPTRGIEFDAKTLDLIDTDKDGRIRAPEILAAVKWACSMVKNPDTLVKGDAALAIGSINDATPEGKQVLASAKQILTNLGKDANGTISIDDTADTVKIFASTKFNGDGIVPPESAADDATAAIVREIIACVGGEPDRSGKPGVTQAKADAFFAEAKAFIDWNDKASSDPSVLVLGDKTAAALDAVKAVRAKVDDYFARCKLAAFDSRAIAALNREEKEYLSLAAKDLTITACEVAAFPLARIEAGRPLPLAEGVNPAWSSAIAKLNAEVIKPLIGDRGGLLESEWVAINAKLAAYEAWAGTKAGVAVEKLGAVRVREILAGGGKDALAALIAKDKALEPEANAIAAVDRLVRYNRDLVKLLNNFVNFRDFYSRKEKSVFQAGRLYLDTRACDLCVRVEDMGRHGAMAHLSQSYLAYCDLTRKATGEKMTVACAFTGGDSDNLMVGRNGIFYDRKGQDWDATIVKIVDNPISIRQAFWSPYKRAIRWIEDQIAKRAAAADAASTSKLTDAAAATGEAATTGQAPTAKPKIDVGTVAALGVAVGGITGAFAVLVGAFFGLGFYMPLGILGIVLLISGPSMVIAWLKLRQRNLGPILDANGWAVNAKAKINIPFGGSLTAVATLPPGSSRDLADPYAESNRARNWTITLVIIAALLGAAWYLGFIERVAPGLLPPSGYVKRQQEAAEKERIETAKKKAEAEATKDVKPPLPPGTPASPPSAPTPPPAPPMEAPSAPGP